MRARRKAQTTLEYIIVFTAIVSAILLIAYSAVKPGLEKIYNQTGTELGDAANRLSNLNP